MIKLKDKGKKLKLQMVISSGVFLFLKGPTETLIPLLIGIYEI